ncbi:MAG: DUF4855 domain-containing protein [Bacteroidales bacterium]|jgi:hypothetical protein|nr:DUF4855 domain-containing protein [Bacteroidales bacterium]
MSTLHFKILFLLFFTFLLSTSVACSKDSGENPNRQEETNPVLSGVTRGFRQGPILDMALIYQGGVQRVDWTPGEMRPYVIHTDQSNRKDWFFDGFLFLEFQDGKGFNFNPGYSGNRQARKQEWEWLADRNFENGKAIKALNTCIADAKKELGEPSFKHQVVIGLPEPFLDQKDWGEINGAKMDFSKQEDRIAASKWYIDLLNKKFEESNLNHLELAGFYWVSEQMSTNRFITADIGDYIRTKGQKFYWIPYYMSTGYSQWKDYGFDIAYLQPNYFFDKKIGDDRVQNACELAFTHNMGMEMEFDARALADNTANHRDRLITYINTYKEQGVFKNSSIAYYEGGRGIYMFSQSANPKDREILDLLQSIIRERRVRMLESIVYRQDFTTEKTLDEKIWKTWNRDLVKLSENGLEISSGGNITKFNTSGKLDMTYGRIEVTARILAKNSKIRLHLLPAAEKLGSWPASGELFLMCYDGASPTKIRVGANTDQMNENKGNIRESHLYWGNQYNQTHTFVCEWEEKAVTFYVDGVKVNIQEDLFDRQYSTYPNYWPFNEKFYLEISVFSDLKDPSICIESIKINNKQKVI